MRICQLTVAHRPIDERILQKISVSLAGAGHEVVFLAPFSGAAHVVGNVQVIPLAPATSKWGRLLKSIPEAVRAVARGRFDVVHVHDPELFPLAPLLRLMGKRVVIDVHEDYGWNLAEKVRGSFPQFVTRWIVWTLQWACGFTANAVVTVDGVTAGLFPGLRPVVIGNYPPRSIAVADREEGGRGTGPFEVVYVGNMSPERGLSVLVEAIDSIDDFPVRLNLLGTMAGSDLLASVRHTERFLAHGRLPWKQTLELMRSFHAGVLLFQPTLVLTHVSGRGNTKLFEYLGSGLPAIISDFPLLRGLAEETGAALCVDPTRPDKVAAAIRKLAGDGRMWTRMSLAGREAVRDRFNWETDEATLQRLYRTFSRGVG